MSRSPIAYPLHRGADMDGGGAAELQTDIMRFMAILSLCLVAIFALVQSIPMAPPEPPTPLDEAPVQKIPAAKAPLPGKAPAIASVPPPATAAERPIVLTRPEWQPKDGRTTARDEPALAEPVQTTVAEPASKATVESSVADGFTLRFESDAALLRAVAAGKVGFYAITGLRARRMAVSDSRISFWDASTPNSFHEMEHGTVPVAVAEALGQPGDAARWGVTLPGRMTTELKSLMASNTGGILVIAADGHIRLESP